MEMVIINLIPVVLALIFAPAWAENRELSRSTVTFWACVWSLLFGLLGYAGYWLYLGRVK